MVAGLAFVATAVVARPAGHGLLLVGAVVLGEKLGGPPAAQRGGTPAILLPTPAAGVTCSGL
jgi:hypothetical protein